MNKFLIVSSLMLFWAFFEESGGLDFVPPSEREAQNFAEAAPQQRPSGYQENYVPFDAPVIIPARSIQAADQTSAIVPASYTTTSNLETIVTAEPSVVRTIAPSDLEQEQPETEVQDREDIRAIAGSRVNMREGPGTNFAVIATLPRGTEAAIIAENDNDWAQIRLLDSGKTGWMAAWLLSD